MRIMALVMVFMCSVVMAGVYAAPPTPQELEAAEDGPAGPPVPLELGSYGDDDYIDPAIGYGEADRRVMPTYEDYDEDTGLPEVVPSDAVGDF